MRRGTASRWAAGHRALPGAVLAVVTVTAALVAGALVSPVLSPAQAATPSTAYVRVGHLVPGFGAVSMAATLSSYSGQGSPTTLTPSATYGTVGAYKSVPTGFYSLAVRPLGASPDSPPVLSGTLQAQPGAAYTVVGLGTADAPHIAVIPDVFSPPSPGTAQVRVINAAVPGQSASVTAGSDRVASGVPFATATGYAGVPAGSTSLTANAGTRTNTAQTDLTSGDVYTILVLDNGHGGLAMHWITDAAGPSTIPTGGAGTGRGGLAAPTPSWPLLVAGATLAAIGGTGLVVGLWVGVGVRRRRRWPRRAAPGRRRSGTLGLL